MARKPDNSETDDQGVRINRTYSAYSSRTQDDRQLPEVHVPKAFAGFIDFVRTQGVVGLGVGFIVGTSANTLIKSIVTNMINPIVGVATGGYNFADKTVCLNSAASVCKNKFLYGQVLSDLITFLIILVVVYFLVKALKLDKLDKPKESK